MKILYFDTETTGLFPDQNDVVQFSGIMEIDGEVIEEINLHFQPTRWENVHPAALSITGMTIEKLKSFEPAPVAFEKIRNFNEELWSAPLATELLEQLPDYIMCQKRNAWTVENMHSEQYKEISAQSLLDALAEMWLWLKKEKLL